MGFLWKAFRPMLSPFLYLLSLVAKKTENPYDDWVIALAEKLADKFKVAENNVAGGKSVRAVVAVMMKELLLNSEFVKKANLTPVQSGKILLAVLSFVKPDAVDTKEEISAILSEMSGDVALPVYREE